jgi:hypothetical protein
MQTLWVEALGAVNTYVETLAKMLPQAPVTLAVFDSGDKFEIVRNAVQAGEWSAVTDKDAQPRASTPLYDAIVSLCAHAIAAGANKTTLVIMTDGAENASQEATKDTAKAALDAARAKGWDVLFLGANWDAMGQSASVGTQYGHTLNMAEGHMTATMGAVASRTAAYSTGAMPAAAPFSADDRKKGGFKQAP